MTLPAPEPTISRRVQRLLPLLGLAAMSCAQVSSAVTAEPVPVVRPGVESFISSPPASVRGKRIGLITNHTGVDRAGTSIVDRISAAPHMRLVALFGPEHGLRGVAAAGEKIASSVDERTGLPIHSLYGATQKPTPAMMEGIEALVFDMQDVGARPYTYISTMALSMQAAKEKGIPFVVLDRPNPITGVAVEGNMLDTAYRSFVGMYPIPVRHGMTIGELAQLFNREYGIGADLTVVRTTGWRREQWFDETGLPWINPSPNIRRLEAAIHYPGTVFFEPTNLSEGRGTQLPFEQTGASWLRAAEVVSAMNAMRLPGVRFETVQIAHDASARKFRGQTVPGVRLILTDRHAYKPVRTSLLLIDTIRRLHPADFQWSTSVNRLAGTDRLRKAMDDGSLGAVLEEWDRDAARFRQIREPYLLY